MEFLQTRLHDVRAGTVRDEGDRAMTVFARQERPRELLAGDFPRSFTKHHGSSMNPADDNSVAGQETASATRESAVFAKTAGVR